MPQHGFEVLVSENDAAKAKDIAAAMGFGIDETLAESTDEAEEIAEEAAEEAEAIDSADEPQETQPEGEEKSSPAAGVFLTILALAGIAVFVWLCDFVIQWVIGLFR